MINNLKCNIYECLNLDMGMKKFIRDRSFITSQGGAVVLEGGYNNYFKTSAFLGGKFFSGKKHEGGQIL